MEFGFSFLYHLLAEPVRVIDNTLHITSGPAPCSSIQEEKVSIWSPGAVFPSDAGMLGILNRSGNGCSNTRAVNGEIASPTFGTDSF